MDEPDHKGVPKRGQTLFAVLFMALAGFLALSYPSQITWVEKTRLFTQPGFWPAVSVTGIGLFTALHWLHLRPRRVRRDDWLEGLYWLTVLEFALWFLAYVWLVPRIGYIFASVLFVPALGLRMGYRGRFWLAVSVAFAVIVVVVFKGFLDVKIPGGAIYDYFPSALRNFFIQNL